MRTLSIALSRFCMNFYFCAIFFSDVLSPVGQYTIAFFAFTLIYLFAWAYHFKQIIPEKKLSIFLWLEVVICVGLIISCATGSFFKMRLYLSKPALMSYAHAVLQKKIVPPSIDGLYEHCPTKKKLDYLVASCTKSDTDHVYIVIEGKFHAKTYLVFVSNDKPHNELIGKQLITHWYVWDVNKELRF